MAQPQIVTGRVLVTLDDGEQNVGRIVQHTCIGESRLMIPYGEIPEGEPPPERQRYDHIVFVREMSDEVEIDEVTYRAMSVDAVLAVIPD